MHTRQWQQLNEVRRLFDEQVDAVERESAGFLVKTPYVLLLSVTGINVVSAAKGETEKVTATKFSETRTNRQLSFVDFVLWTSAWA